MSEVKKTTRFLRVLVNKNLIRICLFTLALCLFSPFLFSQSIRVSAKIDSNSIRIGEQTQIHVSINYRGDRGKIEIQWPKFRDTLIGKVEVLSTSKIDTTIPDKSDPVNFVQTQHLTITSFDSGFYAIPPFKFIVNGDSAHPYSTEAMLFQVNNVKVDTTQAIKDIKPPLSEPFSWRELLPYIYVALGVAVLVVIIYFLIEKLTKRKPKEIVQEKPKIPPHIIALEELEKLKQENLWQEGKTKLYYSRLTDTLRYYIEGRFKIPAMEQTSDEIMASFRSAVIDSESKAKLKQTFLLADLVKFAKEQPSSAENELSLTYAFDFVKGTLREEAKEKSKGADVVVEGDKNKPTDKTESTTPQV